MHATQSNGSRNSARNHDPESRYPFSDGLTSWGEQYVCTCAEGKRASNGGRVRHIDDGNNGQFQRTDYRHVVVRIDPAITEGLPDQLGDHHVEYMDDNAIIARYKTLGKSFPVFTIGPMKNAEGRLKVVVTRGLAGVKKHRLMLAISDWGTVWFAYNCDQREFAIDSVKLDGV